MSEQTYARLLNDGLAALRTHSGVVLDATFCRRAKRGYLREECAKAHVRLQIIELDATESEIVSAIMRARDQSTEKSRCAARRFRTTQRRLRAARRIRRGVGQHSADATSDSAAETAKAVSFA